MDSSNRYLTVGERQLLLALLTLGQHTDVVELVHATARRSRQPPPYGRVYVYLDGLEKKGMVHWILSDGGPERDGLSCRIYWATAPQFAGAAGRLVHRQPKSVSCSDTHPPRFALRLLRMALPHGFVREVIAGDVIQDFRFQVQSGTAKFWFWRQTVSIVRTYAVPRLVSTPKSALMNVCDRCLPKSAVRLAEARRRQFAMRAALAGGRMRVVDQQLLKCGQASRLRLAFQELLAGMRRAVNPPTRRS